MNRNLGTSRSQYPKGDPPAFDGIGSRLPVPFVVLAAGIILSFLSDQVLSGLGIRVTYLGWMIPLLGSGLYLILLSRPIRFPILIWLPWSLWLLVYLLFSRADNALQRCVMMLAPLVVGAAFSTLPVNIEMLKRCYSWIDWLFFGFLAMVGIATGFLLSGQINAASNFAVGAITASLIATWYAARYATLRDRKSLIFWLVLALVPVAANTRMGMIAVAFTLPFTLAPLSFARRIMFLTAMVFAGLLLFETEHIQRKMFYSGQGTLEEAFRGLLAMLSGDSRASFDFATSGRWAVNRALLVGLDNAYWFGHGANSTEQISMAIQGIAHPHNDWLKLHYEYGMLGLCLFALTMAGQMAHAYRRAKKMVRPASIFLYAGASSFIPMTIFMISDNVILYAAWFGNLQFALLGFGYAALHECPEDEQGHELIPDANTTCS